MIRLFAELSGHYRFYNRFTPYSNDVSQFLATSNLPHLAAFFYPSCSPNDKAPRTYVMPLTPAGCVRNLRDNSLQSRRPSPGSLSR